jgi:hypothetical protein
MSRRIKGGSHKASAGIKMRIYRIFHLVDGVEVEHSKKTFGENVVAAMKGVPKDINVTRLKLK